MNLDQLLSKTQGLAQALRTELRREVETVAQDGLVLATQRVSEEGKDASGTAFKPYSETLFPVQFFINHGAIKLKGRVFDGPKVKGKRRKRVDVGAKYPNGIKYQQYKMEVGRDVGFVNLTLTGQMLSSTGLAEGPADRYKNIGIKSSTGEGDRITVIVGPRDQHTADKMEGNYNVRPGWNHLSQKEIVKLAGYSKERMSDFIQRFIND